MSQFRQAYDSYLDCERLNNFLNKNGEFITKNKSKEKSIEIYHYKSSTVVIEWRAEYLLLNVCSDTREKSEKLFNELEKVLLGKK